MATSRSTFIEVCLSHAEQLGERPAYIFSNGDEETTRLSFLGLDLEARAIAAHLQKLDLHGERVILLFDAGYDFIRSFFACLYAGAVAVPVNLPTQRARVEKLRAIAENSGARLALTTAALGNELADAGLPIPCVDPSALDRSEASAWKLPDLRADSPAFLQYTSGSTGTPKGVLVSHGNLLANQQMIRDGFGHDETTVFAGWLPLYHDMGLVGNVLQPAFLGIPCALMSPIAFIQKPIRWLRMISRYRATTSGAPNFAYELCVRRIAEDALVDIDLSSWKVAFNGAEPIRASTLDAFSERFAKLGFRRSSFYPCYGMAEGTLFITGGISTHPPVLCDRPAALVESATADGSIPGALVGCGRAWGEEEVIIVDPERREPCGDRLIGEIWVSGPNVAQGYWMNPEATEETFRAYTREGRGPYLRTGDLGFLSGHELVVTGRLKDLVIVAGKNHYPQDIERTASESHAAFDGRPGAAFAVVSEAGEELVVVQEVNRRFLHDHQLGSSLRECIREAIARDHQIRAKQIVLIKPGALPMTTSGKVQRSLCRRLLSAGSLAEVLVTAPTVGPATSPELSAAAPISPN